MYGMQNQKAAFCAQNDDGDCVYEDLDRLISTEEVKTAMKSLKNSKSPGEDNILNEHFIEAGDILISHITDIFNGIFNTGVFPESWSKGIIEFIVPVYKKGDPTLADNYRAITLSSCMSKLFTSILNNRIHGRKSTINCRTHNSVFVRNVQQSTQFSFSKI